MTTTVHLPPDLSRFVDEKVQSGEFPNAEALVNEALREKATRDANYQEWAKRHIMQALADVHSDDATYASFDVVSSWVDSWGSENEQQKPVCK